MYVLIKILHVSLFQDGYIFRNNTQILLSILWLEKCCLELSASVSPGHS